MEQLKRDQKANAATQSPGILRYLRQSAKTKRKVGREAKTVRLLLVDQHDIEEERGIMKELNKWSKIEEDIYKQKSRVQWLKLRDDNTRYFFCIHEE